jgi:hypothetical protein
MAAQINLRLTTIILYFNLIFISFTFLKYHIYFYSRLKLFCIKYDENFNDPMAETGPDFRQNSAKSVRREKS